MSDETEEAPSRNRRPTGARPKVINGVEFRCYRIPFLRIGRYEWQNESGNLCAGANYNLKTYYAIKGFERLPTKFRSLEGALKAITS